MTPELRTKRLVLRPLELADAPQIQWLFPKWEIVKYLNVSVPWPYPKDGALTYCRDVALLEVERGESWYWTLRLKNAPAQLIGVISLSTKADENRGFWIDPEWQGQGLMTEACDAVTDYWFEALHLPVLRVPKAILNEASRRMSERQGMRVVWTGEREYVSGKLMSELWEITAEKWRARKRTS
ncbi:MAG TPA: GNAT family N-acetyltransferase [Candidatus Sulfotelmatobacter sp.]|jgi:ribosomal-protein-alanine N-acetyltransferase|nr:GNAT family N-acetyltransferase [Candidatus Sulfotelmatobacter sp.]